MTSSDRSVAVGGSEGAFYGKSSVPSTRFRPISTTADADN